MGKIKGSFDKESKSYSAPLIGPQTDITPENYAEKACAIVMTAGKSTVLYGPDDQAHIPAQWRAWMIYFSRLDEMSKPRGRKASTYNALRVITVPTEWPEDFDATAPLSDRSDPGHRGGYDPRGAVRSAAYGARVPKKAPKPDWTPADDARAARQAFTRPLDELAAEYAERPISVSDDLRKRLQASE